MGKIEDKEQNKSESVVKNVAKICNAVSFKELHKILNSLLRPATMHHSCFAFHENIHYAARQKYRILRRELLLGHPELNPCDVANVPLEKDSDVTIIADLCVNAMI